MKANHSPMASEKLVPSKRLGVTRRRCLMALAGTCLALTLAACGTVQKQSTWLKSENVQAPNVTRVNVVYVRTPLTWKTEYGSGTAPSMSYEIPHVRNKEGFSGLVRDAAPKALAAAGLQGQTYVVDGMSGVSGLLASQSAVDRSGYVLLLYFTAGKMGNYGGSWVQMDLEGKLLSAENAEAVWKGGSILMSKKTPFGVRWIDDEMVLETLGGMLKAVTAHNKG